MGHMTSWSASAAALATGAASRQVGRAGEQAGRQRAQAAHDLAAGAAAADPQRQVDAPADRHHLIGQLEHQPHRRVASAEPRQERRDQRPADLERRGHRDDAGGDGVGGGHRAGGALELAQRPGDLSRQGLALGGRSDAARGADEQPDAEVALEGSDAAADLGPVDRQGAGGVAERAGGGDPSEQRELVEVH
jgi:hypothetical protein